MDRDTMNPLKQAAQEMMAEANTLAEQLRVNKLRSLNVLDTPSEQVYDDLMVLAAASCDMPAAVLTFIDADRGYIKASFNGPPPGDEKRSDAICNTAIQTPDQILIIPDACADERFKDNWKIKAGLARFYAGAPVVMEDGSAVGSVCVIDPQLREFTEENATSLKAVARVIADVLATRR